MYRLYTWIGFQEYSIGKGPDSQIAPFALHQAP